MEASESIYCHTFDLEARARLALNYLTSMTDPDEDWLPYWMVQIHVVPPFARHCRVDDAELVASWYEAITAIRNSFGIEEGAEQQAAFKRHVLKSWGEHGLRFHEPYPWTQTIHSSFHEMAYVLGALNRSIDEWSRFGLPLVILVSMPTEDDAASTANRNLRDALGLLLQKAGVQGIIWSQLQDSADVQAGLFNEQGRTKPAWKLMADQWKAKRS